VERKGLLKDEQKVKSKRTATESFLVKVKKMDEEGECVDVCLHMRSTGREKTSLIVGEIF